MRFILVLALFLIPLSSPAVDLVVPKGFVLQRLVETDGQIVRPENWFFKSGGTPSGWLWTISKEDPAKGPYKTGMRIQLLVGVEKGSGRSRGEFAKEFIAGKRTAAKVVKECAQHDIGDFYRQCIEVVESISGDHAPYRIIYSVMWGKEMDMVVVSTFGAPQANWREAAPIADAMAQFQLIGPKFGK